MGPSEPRGITSAAAWWKRAASTWSAAAWTRPGCTGGGTAPKPSPACGRPCSPPIRPTYALTAPWLRGTCPTPDSHPAPAPGAGDAPSRSSVTAGTLAAGLPIAASPSAFLQRRLRRACFALSPAGSHGRRDLAGLLDAEGLDERQVELSPVWVARLGQ